MSKTPVQFTLNGSETAVFVDPAANLLDVLRRGVGDLSPKYGCGQGLAESAAGRNIETTGGLQTGAEPHPLQTAFMEGFAAQCGYCTPGMLMAAKALLDRNPNPSRDEVIEAISGNLCRCTGYEPIVEAILTAAQRMSGRAA